MSKKHKIGRNIVLALLIFDVFFVLFMCCIPQYMTLKIAGMDGDIYSVTAYDDDGNELSAWEKKDSDISIIHIGKKTNRIVCSSNTENLKAYYEADFKCILEVPESILNAYKITQEEENGDKWITLSSVFVDWLDAWHQLFLAKAVAIGIYVALILLYLLVVLEKSSNIEKLQKKNRIWKMAIGQFAITILLAFSLALPVGFSYLQENFGEVGVAQLIYHLHTDNTGTDWDSFSGLFHDIGVRVIFAIVISAEAFIIFLLLRRESEDKKFKRNMITISVSRLVICVFSINLIAHVLVKFDQAYGLENYLISQRMSSTLYEDYYVNASDAVITAPDDKKNLIYIFLESMETTAADAESGGANPVNVIPELTEIALKNTCFNGNSGVLNGAYVLGSTGWTVAAMVGQTSGTPMAVPVSGNSYEADSFLPGVTSIGEVLEKEGYHNYLLLGSDATFANRKGYFEQHGNYEILDYYWAAGNEYLGEGYPVWWGFDDGKLFEIAEAKLLEMAEKEEPFNLTLLTVDTHVPDGYVCEDCGDAYEDQYSNVFACSSKKVSDFIEWIGQQEFAKDTVIVVCGDHLTMNAEYYENINPEYDRRVYVAILNPTKEEPNIERAYCTLDMFPTTLSAMGFEIEGDRLGLGTDLFSDTPTLLEMMGREQFSNELGLNSKYFNSKLLYGNE